MRVIFLLKKIKKKWGKNAKLVGGVCASQDWSQKIPLAKMIFFYKRDILRKHPQIAKKRVQSLKNTNSQIFLANFSNVDNFY